MMKKFISILLVAALLCSMLSMTALADDNLQMTCLLEVTKDQAPLRASAGKHGEVLVKLEAGDYLTCTSMVRNKAGNLWLVVSWCGETGYIYSGNVREHTHHFEACEGHEEIWFCDCGACQVHRDGMQQTNAAVADFLPLTPALGVAASQLGGLTAALPYVGIAIVGGALIYYAISADCTDAEVEAVVDDLTDIQKISEMEEGSYYYAARAGALLLISPNNPMTMAEAATFLNDIGHRSPFLLQGAGTRLRDVYTASAADAAALAGRMATQYRMEFRHDQAHKPGYYSHYNFTYTLRGHELYLNAHLFYGLPAMELPMTA